MQLMQGKTAIQVRQPFPGIPAVPVAMMGDRPAHVVELAQETTWDALSMAGLQESDPSARQAWGVVMGSSRGQQAQWEALARVYYAPEAASQKNSETELPLLENWLSMLPHGIAIHLTQWLGTGGPVLAPMAACATGIWAIAQGFELIQTRQCDCVIAGAVEAPITPLTLIGFDKMGALAKTGSYPFDAHREGLVLGEGGAVFVLESAAAAQRRGAKIYGRILGVGLTADGYHVSAPDPHHSRAIAAIQHCLHRSHLEPDAIDYIHAHGTGTRLNDQNEAALIQSIFPPKVPVSSTKGATGHTLGASGALGIAFCLQTFQYQALPPCVGLQQMDGDLNLVRSARSAIVNRALCLSFGFGGQNAAIALERAF
jgi:3-oxoacyl-[acyl-carrier-protein] synthase II